MNFLLDIKESYKDENGVVDWRSKYLNRAVYVLYRQRIFKPRPAFIVDSYDLPREVRARKDRDKHLLVSEAAYDIFKMLNEDVFNDVKNLIKVRII